MSFIKSTVKSIPFIKYYLAGKNFLNDCNYKNGLEKSYLESTKTPKRTEIINFLLSISSKKTCYLEIGVRDPRSNYIHIIADEKYSVDPGLEFAENPVDFKMTSDKFFDLLSNGEILYPDIKFDAIFVDGLHLAEQVDRDVANSLKFVKDDGFIVLHDCNPPTEWHAREDHYYHNTPAKLNWNGTTWKAFLKWRFDPSVNSCCVDSDWGVGILSRKQPIGNHTKEANKFFEFKDFAENKETYLNLIGFEDFKKLKLRRV